MKLQQNQKWMYSSFHYSTCWDIQNFPRLAWYYLFHFDSSTRIKKIDCGIVYWFSFDLPKGVGHRSHFQEWFLREMKRPTVHMRKMNSWEMGDMIIVSFAIILINDFFIILLILSDLLKIREGFEFNHNIP